MDPTRINLSAKSSRFICENTEIPPDITFKFTEDASDEQTVSAHKTILSMVSLTFRNMFFVQNTVDKIANVMLLDDTTKEPFQIMIDAVYEVKPMKDNLQGKSLDEVFAVLYLVVKFEIPELELAVMEHLSSFPITEATVLEVASDAERYSSSFEAAVQRILLRCAHFLKPKLTDAKSVLNFVAENGDRNATVYKLVVLMNDMKDVPCSNCGKSPCQHGAGVEASQFRVGLLVSHNPAVQKKTNTDTNGFWGYLVKDFIGEVKGNVDAVTVEVEYRMTFTDGDNSARVASYNVYCDGKCRFLFQCKEIF